MKIKDSRASQPINCILPLLTALQDLKTINWIGFGSWMKTWELVGLGNQMKIWKMPDLTLISLEEAVG